MWGQEDKGGSGVRGGRLRGLIIGVGGRRVPKEEGRNRICPLRGLGCPPQEDDADLPDFNPECAHLLLQGVYGDFLYHNYGSHLGGEGPVELYLAELLAPSGCAIG